ncbi:S24 family peptidase [Filomicrobium insigne]|nr:S24 family peptidase [Filomicrobium insigne]
MTDTETENVAQSRRLRRAREHAGFETIRAAVEQFGWNYNTYKSHDNGKRGFKKRDAEDYAKAYGVTAGWLLTGENPPYWASDSGVSQTKISTRRIPILDWLAVERYLAYRSGTMGAIATAYADINTHPELGRRVFMLPVQGESMVAKPPVGGVSFHPGDAVVFDPDGDVKPGDFVLAKLNLLDEPIFRKYQVRGRDEAGELIFDLVPLNEDYPTERVGPNNPGKVLARLVRHVRNF